MVVPGPRHLQLTTGDVDAVAQILFPLDPVSVGHRRCHHHRTRSGPARAGLPRTTLEHPHRDMLWPTSYDELEVHALRVGPGVVRRADRQGACVVKGINERDGMGI